MTNQPWKFIGFMTNNPEAVKKLLLPFTDFNPEKKAYEIDEFGIFDENLFETTEKLLKEQYTAGYKAGREEILKWAEEKVGENHDLLLLELIKKLK